MNESRPNIDARDTGQRYKIETIRTADGREVSYSPERGGIITSLKLNRGSEPVELLYMDASTFSDPDKNVKGGIPVLFPNAGPNESERFPGLKQHGFARNSGAWVSEPSVEEEEFLETLMSDETTERAYPNKFMLRMHGKLEKDGSMTLKQSVTNFEQDRDVPVAMGLHPYFRVPADRKNEIRFQFPGGEILEQSAEQWANDKAVSIDNPKTKDPEAVLRVSMPGLGTLVMDVSAEYRKIWVWSQTGKDFVCIEPVMRDKGGLVDDPELVKPGSTYTGTLNLRLE